MKTLMLVLLLLTAPAMAKVKIAVIDTGINPAPDLTLCKSGHKDFTGYGPQDSDPYTHGTAIARILSQANDGSYCVVMLKAFLGGRSKNYIKALEYAKNENFAVVVLSLTGMKELKWETKIIRVMLNQKQAIFAAAGNNGITVTRGNCNIYPACLDSRINVISTYGKDYNHGYFVDAYKKGTAVDNTGKIMTGTSFAAPRAAAEYAKILSKLRRGVK